MLTSFGNDDDERDPFGRIRGKVYDDRPDTRGLSTISQSVGMGGKNDRTDVAVTEKLLHQNGVLDTNQTKGPTGYFGMRADQAIRTFQKDKGLKVDGLMLPGGPTIKALQAGTQKAPTMITPGLATAALAKPKASAGTTAAAPKPQRKLPRLPNSALFGPDGLKRPNLLHDGLRAMENAQRSDRSSPTDEIQVAANGSLAGLLPAEAGSSPTAGAGNRAGEPAEFRAAREWLAKEAGHSYGDVLPLKRDEASGELSLAVPEVAREFALGLIDLVEGPHTGAVTGRALAAMPTGAAAGTASRVAAKGGAILAKDAHKEVLVRRLAKRIQAHARAADGAADPNRTRPPNAQSITFGKLTPALRDEVNRIREELGQLPLDERQLRVFANVVEKLAEKRVIQGGQTPRQAARAVYDAFHGKGSKAYEGKYPHNQNIVNARKPAVGFIGRTQEGKTSIKSGFRSSSKELPRYMGRREKEKTK